MSASRGRVLIVDDDADVREVLSLVLSMEGFDVRHAQNGDEALRLLRAWRANLIILDLMMPVMDGPTFRAEQKATAALADIPVLVLSASRQPWGPETKALDAAAMLSKPFELDVLISSVCRLTSERVSERTLLAATA